VHSDWFPIFSIFNHNFVRSSHFLPCTSILCFLICL
jgi:hypothetical protein